MERLPYSKSKLFGGYYATVKVIRYAGGRFTVTRYCHRPALGKIRRPGSVNHMAAMWYTDWAAASFVLKKEQLWQL